MAVGFSGLLPISGIRNKKRVGWSALKIELGFVLCGKLVAEKLC